jgi:hypothetical protein
MHRSNGSGRYCKKLRIFTSSCRGGFGTKRVTEASPESETDWKDESEIEWSARRERNDYTNCPRRVVERRGNAS